MSHDATPTNCPDCSVKPGTPHASGCDVARCVADGSQRLMCEMIDDDQGHDCGKDVWTGRWPGEAECEELGWWCYFGPTYGETGWVRCSADDPRAVHDLNRLVEEADWDPRQARWVLPDAQATPRNPGKALSVEEWAASLSAADCELIVHGALEKQDMTAVDAAMRLLARKDPRRASALLSIIRLGLEIRK